MAKHLWLLRHGEAVPHGARSDDGKRELTPKGERQSTDAGRALKGMRVKFDACYASPKLRARDTARLAVASLDVEVVEVKAMAGKFARADAAELLGAHRGHVLMVGHEPDFAQIVYEMTGARVHLKKGGLAVVKVSSSSELILLLRPAELAAMAR